MTDESLVLAGEFPQPTEEDWDREVLKVLNRKRAPGTELNIEESIKRLTTIAVDGLVTKPLYTKPDDQIIGYPAQVPFTRGSSLPCPDEPWIIEQLHEDPNVTTSNANVLDDLNKGGSGVWLRVDPDAIAAGDVAKVLAGVIPGAADVSVSSINDQNAAATALADFFTASGKAAEARGSFGIDPLGAAVITGKPADLSGLAGWVAKAKAFPKARAVVVDVTPYDNAGAGDIEQLAYAIATGIEYVRALGAAGVTPAEAFDQILFRVGASTDEFTTIARIRALRRLWSRVGEVLDVPECKRGAVQHAVTSLRVLTRDDPWVNLLRDTVAAVASSVAGADKITVLPHDTVYGLPTKFSRRVARNIQLLCSEETHLGEVKDPAGGSWALEGLTDELAKKAWALVQAIEAAGGQVVAVTSGLVSEQIAKVNTERAKRIATRKLSITGTSQFPKQGEELFTDFTPRPSAPVYTGLRPKRDSEVFEGLRDRSRNFKTAKGKNPEVLMACLGEQRDFGGRETFTSNVLWVGGIDNPEIKSATPEEIAKAAVAGKFPVVIIASSAKVYAEQAITVAKALKAAGVGTVAIAGRKTETGSAEVDQFIDVEIFDGMNVVAFLTDTLDKLGAAK
ncbi:MAG: methylmalonyl-CoA mutase family protein [Propionibacteriaceae bacterium]|jgi:methylmalonyl-CoA mutase|nr:methylmalonyl-CoA mutase family protein [Propionibacteriaceae bacterium]